MEGSEHFIAVLPFVEFMLKVKELKHAYMSVYFYNIAISSFPKFV